MRQRAAHLPRLHNTGVLRGLPTPSAFKCTEAAFCAVWAFLRSERTVLWKHWGMVTMGTGAVYYPESTVIQTRLCSGQVLLLKPPDLAFDSALLLPAAGEEGGGARL